MLRKPGKEKELAVFIPPGIGEEEEEDQPLDKSIHWKIGLKWLD
jgi:hypothetical protein